MESGENLPSPPPPAATPHHEPTEGVGGSDEETHAGPTDTEDMDIQLPPPPEDERDGEEGEPASLPEPTPFGEPEREGGVAEEDRVEEPTHGHHHGGKEEEEGGGAAEEPEEKVGEEDADDSHDGEGEEGGSGGVASPSHEKKKPREGGSGNEEDDIEKMATFLKGLKMEMYVNTFRDEAIGMDALLLLSDEDLKELGVKLGHRRLLMKHIRVCKPFLLYFLFSWY